MKLLLTPDEAAQALGVSRSTVYELINSGELTAIRIGRSRRVPTEVLERFVRARTEETTS